MIIILESWTGISCLAVHFYDESVVSTTSVRINFRENVIAAFTNYDRKKKLHVIQKNKQTNKKNRQSSPFAEQLMIASA